VHFYELFLPAVTEQSEPSSPLQVRKTHRFQILESKRDDQVLTQELQFIITHSYISFFHAKETTCLHPRAIRVRQAQQSDLDDAPLVPQHSVSLP
jgi:hypothetical protein